MSDIGRLQSVADRVSRPFASQVARLLTPFVEATAKANASSIVSSLENELSRLKTRIVALESREGTAGNAPWRHTIHIPSPAVYQRPASTPFMAHSTCAAGDLFHPRCAEIGALFNHPPVFHRKFWEWVFIIHCAILNEIGQSKKALGFGVGTEPIPAVLAKLGAQIVATDAPEEIGVGNGWTQNDEFANSAEKLRFDGDIDNKGVFAASSPVPVLADIEDTITTIHGFDFAGAVCCLEHLGSLQHGMDFIVNSVEKTLKVGGIACHTTELNLSSNDDTVESGPTVIYRKRDLDALVAQLRERGHEVGDIRVAPDAHHLDGYVDLPPYREAPHLKLELAGYAITSVGIIVKRGR